MSTDKYDIYVESFINEGFVETYFIQYFNNNNNNEINVFEHTNMNMNINICKEMQFVDFEIEMGDKKIKTKVIPNKVEEIKNELERDENGNKIKKKDNSKINIVLKPHESIKIKTHYIQSLISQDLTYIYRLMRTFPYFYSSFYGCPHSLKANIYFQTYSKVSKFDSKVDGGYSNIKYNFKDKKIQEIQIILERIKLADNQIYNSNIPLISIMFQTENYNSPKLYKQYNPLTDETSYLFSFSKIKNNKDKNIKTPSSICYLLINEEYNNQYIKNICKSLLEPLSNDNYFQIIEYQKYVKLYNILPLKCEKKNIEKTISLMKNVNYNYNLNYNSKYNYKYKENIFGQSNSNKNNDIKTSIEGDEKDINKPFEYIFNCKQEETKDLNKFVYIIGHNLNVDKNDISRLMEKYKNIDKKI